MNYNIFISYAGEDNDLAQLLCDSLGRIVQFRPYKAENDHSFQIGFKERIQKEISNCSFVIALLTEKGKSSQFVNQEIGYAFAAKRYNKILNVNLKNVPIIIPVSQKSVNLRGFVTKDSDDILFIENYDTPESVIAEIIFSLRKIIPNGLGGKTLKLNIFCPNCTEKNGLPHRFEVYLPEMNVITNLIQKNKALKYECPKCARKIRVDARTYLSLEEDTEESIFEDIDEREPSGIGKL